MQPFFFISQDLTDGLPGNIQRMVARVQQTFPRFLVMRVLMVGCAVGEGQVACSEPWAVQALHEALRVVARQARASVIVFKDYPARHREALSLFSSDGYCRVPSMPAAKVDLDYKDFEDYMQRRVGKVFRKNLRRKFRASEEIGRPEMTVCEDVSGIIDEIYPLYKQTLSRAEFSFEELTPEFLARIGREMPDKARFFIWRLDGKIVAFNFCLLHDGVLYDMDIGLDYSVALDLHLYFITWRDVFNWAIEQRRAHLLHRAAQLRPEAAPAPRARPAGPLRLPHLAAHQSRLPPGDGFPPAGAPSPHPAQVSQRA